MTTTVKVEAHCSSNKEVVVEISTRKTLESIILEDGEQREVLAYDDRKIRVFEREKAAG